MTLQEKLFPDPESVSAERESPMEEQIPEAKGSLTWIDTFCDRKKGIVAVFDVDPKQVSKQKMLVHLVPLLLLVSCLVFMILGPQEFFLEYICSTLAGIQLAAAYKEYQSGGKDHHVAITTEGIRVDPNPSMSVTTKFQSIESCELATSGAIHVKSTRSTKVGWLVGLRNPLCGVLRPEECVNLVQAMKKRHCESTVNAVGFASSSMLRKSDYRDIPEAQHVTWKDPFYDGNDSIIAVFDRDNDGVRRGTIADMLVSISLLFLLFVGMFWAVHDELYFLLFLCVFLAIVCFSLLRTLGEDQHLALTSEGIRLDHGPHYFITLPYDSFSTCQVIPCNSITAKPGWKQITLSGHPKGSRGAPNFLGLRELLIGIEQAQEFADLVMAMKRKQAGETSVDNLGDYKGVETPESVQIV